MRSIFITSGAALGLACPLLAQQTQAPDVAPSPTYAGTYYTATGLFTPAGAQEGAPDCGYGLIYNNTISPTGFYHNAAYGNTIIDEGRIPSTSSGGPASEYLVNGFSLAYSTDQATVDLQISFWEMGDTCDPFSILGPPTASYTLVGMPGAPSGFLTSLIVDVNLNGGGEFAMKGDSNGVFGDDWDRFAWGFKVLGQSGSAGDHTGPIIAGHPNACSFGSGTFGDTAGCDGLGHGTGLGTMDAFRREADGPATPDCYYFGGYPASPFSSFYLKLNSNAQNDTCDGAVDLGASSGASVATYDNCCASTSGVAPTSCSTTGSTSSMGRDLWYLWTAPANGTTLFDTFGSGFDTKLAVWTGPDCGTATCIAYNDDTGGLQSRVSVSTTAGTIYLIQVAGFGSSCGSGQLNITLDPCVTATDDGFEENDDCGQQVALGDGTYLGLFVSKTDWDYYEFAVAPGATLQVDLTFTHASGDLDMFLYPTGVCRTFADGNVGCTSSVACGFSASNNETLSYTNTGLSAETMILKVNVYPPTTTGNCNNYDMEVSGTVGDRIGSSYCGPGVQNPNSTGNIGRLSVYGSLPFASDDLHLVATNLPANQSGYFVWSTSMALINLPGAGLSDGWYCLGSGQGRFNGQNGGQGMVHGTGGAGTFSLLGIDTTDMPQSTGPAIAIFANLTGYFQAWYRDPLGTIGNNFTDAVSVTWTL